MHVKNTIRKSDEKYQKVANTLQTFEKGIHIKF